MLYKKENKFGDEWSTPSYAIKPLLKYLKPNSRIWCPFDTEESNFVKVLKEAGHSVYYSHISDLNGDFFELLANEWIWKDTDYIISNPPFSLKTKVLTELYKFGKPFAILLPVPSLDGIARHKLFNKYGLELMIFDRRIAFNNMKSPTFGSAYFCYKVLPKQIIFTELEKEKDKVVEQND